MSNACWLVVAYLPPTCSKSSWLYFVSRLVCAWVVVTVPNAWPCNVSLVCHHNQCIWKNYYCARGGSWRRFGPRASVDEDSLPVALDAINCIHYASTCLLLNVRRMKTSCLTASSGFVPLNGWVCLCVTWVWVDLSVVVLFEVLGSCSS